jgi:plasmid stabilization system protein ParE
MSIDIQSRAHIDIELAADELREWKPSSVDVFIARLNQTLETLELLPHSAGRYEPPNPAFPGLRVQVIRKDYGYVVLYLPTEDGISVVRVLHGAQNISVILG